MTIHIIRNMKWTEVTIKWGYVSSYEKKNKNVTQFQNHTNTHTLPCQHNTRKHTMSHTDQRCSYLILCLVQVLTTKRVNNLKRMRCKMKQKNSHTTSLLSVESSIMNTWEKNNNKTNGERKKFIYKYVETRINGNNERRSRVEVRVAHTLTRSFADWLAGWLALSVQFARCECLCLCLCTVVDTIQ